MIRMLLCGVQYPIASAFLGALWVRKDAVCSSRLLTKMRRWLGGSFMVMDTLPATPMSDSKEVTCGQSCTAVL